MSKSEEDYIVNAGSYIGRAAVSIISSRIEQKFIFMGGSGEQGKVMEMRKLLRNGLKPPILLIVQTKNRASKLFHEIIYDSISIVTLHSSPASRASFISKF